MTTKLIRRIGPLLAVFALLAAACGGDDDDDDTAATDDETSTTEAATDDGEEPAASDLKIAFFTDALDNAWLTAGVEGAETVTAEAGVELEVFSADWDVNKQLTQIEDAAASGEFDALVVEAIDGQSVCSALQQAADDGMVVSIYNTPICGNLREMYTDGTIGFFGRDEYEGGYQLGVQLAESVGGSGPVGYISGPVQNSIVQITTEGFKAALAEYPDIELVAEADGQWVSEAAVTAVEDVLQAHPDIAGLAISSDTMTIPVLDAIGPTGQLDGVKLVTEGGSQNAFDLILEGIIYAAVAGLPYSEAAHATSAAIAVLLGEDIAVPGWDADAKVYDYLKDPIFDGGPPIFNADNVESHEAEWEI